MSQENKEKKLIYRPVSPRVDLPSLEESILEFWRENDIFKKSLEAREGQREYVFYEGPPTANGKPGSHHVLSRIFKDIFPRYRTMCGYYVPRKAGWDTHGLPVELEVEKELGISGKQDIEKVGIAEFNRLCRESIYRYLEDWEKLTERIGFWIDTADAYFTLDNGYIESVWWLLKEIWKKGLLFHDYKVVPYCSRCGTALSSHEVDQGYRIIEEPSVFVRFPLADDPDLALLVWTTTPWTLISNVAAAISPEIEYVETASSAGRLVMAEPLVEKVLGAEARIVRWIPRDELIGRSYIAPYGFIEPDGKAHTVVPADFISSAEGTGIVHIAPAFGADDMAVARAHELPIINAVTEEGVFDARITPWAGQFVKEADPGIIEDLDNRGLLVSRISYEHSYPHCWRCDTPLIYYAKVSWYIRTTAIKDELLAANESVNWYPHSIKYGRFGNWLENNIDWALSRERYWGTPLPVWRCEQGHEVCIGSIEELGSLATSPLPGDLDLHRPFIDELRLRCPDCGRDMSRVTEVIDAWFDSGSMPMAQWHYPFENKEIFEKRFPADFICEAIDQTRGWFYSLMAVSTLLFGKSSYKNVICLGHILDREGQKMSKSKGNVVEPWQILDRQGADAFRWYLFTASSPWFPRRFFPEAVDEVVRKFLLTLWNTYSFFTVYANIDGFDPTKRRLAVAERPLLDRWVIASLNRLVTAVREGLDNYDVTGSGRQIQEFVDDLSNWYVRRSRRRFWKSEEDTDKLSAYLTLYECLITVAKLLAPYTPFISEEIYRNLACSVDPGAPEAVHLCDFPESDPELVDEDLLFAMDIVRRVISLGRAARNKAAIKTRQPLRQAVVTAAGKERRAVENLSHLVLDELNVKGVSFVADPSDLAGVRLKPDLKKLGPRFGPRRPQVDAAIAAMDPRRAVDELQADGRIGIVVEGREEILTSDELLVEEVEKEGFSVERHGGRAVGITTEITPELKREGIARELVHKVQIQRKEAGFEIEDHIDCDMSGSPLLIDVIREYQDFFKAETLCRGLTFGKGPLKGGTTSPALAENETVVISITKTGPA
ncbi:MAG: isoleucine--tRNA ligase [Thermoleophilia bacterium]|nr:isoleucine--tRNA ligase [Thermoleophilia bacterium]